MKAGAAKKPGRNTGVLLSLAVGLLVLVLAALLQFRDMFVPAVAIQDSVPVRLADAFPGSAPGRTVVDLPLGDTEAVSGRAERILEFDDFIFRSYATSAGNYAIYAAYWQPGKKATRLVAAHTPDRCWSNSGWNCLEMRFGETLDGDTTLMATHWRKFAAPHGAVQYVMFWHLVGDELYEYGDRFNRVPSGVQLVRDAVKQFFSPPREQYFIRLTSDRPFEEIQDDPGFQEVVAALAQLGLRAISDKR